MRSRYLAAGAAIWAAVYGCGYTALIYQQVDSSVAWWYVALVAGGVAALVASAAGNLSRSAVILGAVLLASAALLAAASIGMFLLPAVVGAGVAIAGDRPARVQT